MDEVSGHQRAMGKRSTEEKEMEDLGALETGEKETTQEETELDGERQRPGIRMGRQSLWENVPRVGARDIQQSFVLRHTLQGRSRGCFTGCAIYVKSRDIGRLYVPH